MAGVAEKARFYLERSVPQLREWEEKEIFAKDEIRTIVQKRSDFEHRVLAPGCLPADFSSYAAWEQSLEALRTKRTKRLKISRVTSQHTGQGRVLAIYDRGVNRHPGSGELWREYLDYTAKVKATKRWRRTMTRALRMKPRDAELWVQAGRRSAKNGDMATARGFFMRGCRFCSAEATVWVEYARCEMEWLGRMEAKNTGKKTGEALKENLVREGEEIEFRDGEDEDEDEDGNLMLPDAPTQEKEVFTNDAVQKLEHNPAMDGAIPTAIFDISRKQGFFNADVAERFFDMFASCAKVSVRSRILQHVLESMQAEYTNEPATWNCYIRQPILGISPYTAEFPRGLGESLARLKGGLEAASDKPRLQNSTAAWIDAVLDMGDLDSGIRTVLEHTRGKLLV